MIDCAAMPAGLEHFNSAFAVTIPACPSRFGSLWEGRQLPKDFADLTEAIHGPTDGDYSSVDIEEISSPLGGSHVVSM